VLVELDLLVTFETIEVLEEQELLLRLASRASPTEVFNERPRVNFLLDVQRDSGDRQGTSVLLVLPPPDELWVGVGVPWVEKRSLIGNGSRVPLIVGNEVSEFLCRDVRPFVGMDC
jgi:hypothetical protein